MIKLARTVLSPMGRLVENISVHVLQPASHKQTS